VSIQTAAEVVAHLDGVERHYHMGTEIVRALDGIDLKIRKGDYLAIMGRSGSGKSTLLNILGLLDRPTAGEYRLEDHEVSKLTDTELSGLRGQRIGFIFQSFNLIPQLTVLENLEVPLFYQNRIGAESKAKAEQLAIRVGLEGRLNHRPAELSGGQQQRVAIARSLMNDPLYLLADEPTGNLDTSTEQEILEILDELHADGVTVIMVTHNPEMTKRAERIVRLADGKVESITENPN
jgi:putative ABC transport system ATP-binding protein